jgi:hypothetical protein
VWASELDHFIGPIERRPDEADQALKRIGVLLGPRLEVTNERAFMRFDYRLGERLLGLEVIVNVSERDSRSMCNVREGGALKPLLVQQAFCRTDELLTLLITSIRLRHRVSYFTNSANRNLSTIAGTIENMLK